MKHPLTLAYKPKEFFELGAMLAQWATDETIYSSFPTIEEHEGRTYYCISFGYSPESSGVQAYFAYDDLNDEFCYWCSEGVWDWGKDWQENCDVVNACKFATLQELKMFVVFGES